MRLSSIDAFAASSAATMVGHVYARPSSGFTQDERERLQAIAMFLSKTLLSTWLAAGTESAPTRAERIEKRLNAMVDWPVSEQDRLLVSRALREVADQVDVNPRDYELTTNAREYGVTASLLRALAPRLEAPEEPAST